MYIQGVTERYGTNLYSEPNSIVMTSPPSVTTDISCEVRRVISNCICLIYWRCHHILLNSCIASFQVTLFLGSFNNNSSLSSSIRLRPLGLFLPPGNHLPISFVVFLHCFSLQVCKLTFFGWPVVIYSLYIFSPIYFILATRSGFARVINIL